MNVEFGYCAYVDLPEHLLPSFSFANLRGPAIPKREYGKQSYPEAETGLLTPMPDSAALEASGSPLGAWADLRSLASETPTIRKMMVRTSEAALFGDANFKLACGQLPGRYRLAASRFVVLLNVPLSRVNVVAVDGGGGESFT